MSTSTSHIKIKIKSADIKPGDIIKFEYGDYGNWVTAVIDSVSIDSNSKDSATYYPLKLIWHYLSDEKGAPKEAQEKRETPKDCRAEKLGNNPAWKQFISYSNPNDIVEKLN